jgi:hypothetical protein
MEGHLNEKWALVVGAVTMDMYNYSKKTTSSWVPLLSLLALQIVLFTSLAPSIYNYKVCKQEKIEH